MNFLRNSFSTITEAPPPPPHHNNDTDRDLRLHPPPLQPQPPSLPPHLSSSSSSYYFEYDGDDARFPPPPPPSAVDSLRTRNRVPMEDHVDVTEEDGGGVLVPSRELPDDWHQTGDMASIMELDRNFLFPGECINIVLYVSSHGDSKNPELITPFKVAAAMDKARLSKEESKTIKTTILGNENLETDNAEHENVKGTSSVNVLWMEEQKKRSVELLHLFQNSHFFTRLSEAEEQVLANSSPSGEEVDDRAASASPSEHRKSTESSQPLPILMERGGFDPRYAGGVARNARCYSFGNGIIAVVLQITVGINLKNDVMLEVLQFKQPCELGKTSDHMITETLTSLSQRPTDSSEELLQWLLPLENPLHMPSHTVAAAANSFVNSSPQKHSFSSSSGSTLFSFASMRTYSTSSSHSSQTSAMASTQAFSTNGLDESESLKSSKGQSVSNEGLIAFRGIQLEPQRFSVHCGLDGLYVPGRRWKRKLQIVEPLLIESYFADCNTKDLICVSIENVVPDHLPEVLVIIDSISIVCEMTDPSRTASPVPIACIEVGENHKLPGTSLRPGEQHSFVLKPSKSPFLPSVSNTVRVGPTGPASSSRNTEVQTTKASYYSTDKKKAKEHKLVSAQDLGNYVLVVSCRCNHSASRLHFKHPMKWQPRSPRDLLLSVSLESTTEPAISEGIIPSLVPKVVTVQATNLTSESLHLTLLTPSSKYLGSCGQVPVCASSGLSRINSFMSFHGRKEWPSTKTKDLELEQTNGESSPNSRPSSLQRSMSLPPVRPIESIMGITPRVVKERAISAADIAAENVSVRTHLLLQSIIPLGTVPAQATTAIRCELLPLTDGIITLDTLHISTKDREIYYPEKPLQIYATSSISIGIP